MNSTVNTEKYSITPGMENYLKAILNETKETGITRVKILSERLNVKMPSVTAALSRLESAGLVEYEKYGYIELTDLGKNIASQLNEKFYSILSFFKEVLRFNSIDSERIACGIEHQLSDEDCCRINRFLIFYREEEKQEASWIKRKKVFLKS